MVAGAAYKSDWDSDFAVARLNMDGSLDKSFSADGKRTIAFDLGGRKLDEVSSVATLPDGSILLAGRATSTSSEYDYAIARVRPDGTLDTSFNGTGKVYSRLSGDDYFTAISVQSNGKIIGVGTSSIVGDYDFGIVRLLSQ